MTITIEKARARHCRPDAPRLREICLVGDSSRTYAHSPRDRSAGSRTDRARSTGHHQPAARAES